jgi:hypothetical protein
MARLHIPDRFMVRSAQEYTEALRVVGEWYWWLASRGELDLDTVAARYITGAYDALRWMGGAIGVPPGFVSARLRTRYDLVDVLRIVELACFDDISRWEAVMSGNTAGALEHIDRDLATGARVAYEWALGLRQEPIRQPLPPEYAEAGLNYFRRQAAARQVA